MAERRSHFVRALAGAVAFSIAFAARADAPPGRFVASGEAVFDSVTKLTWQRTAGSGYDRVTAERYCRDVVLAGVTGWRLPTLHELYTIIDERRSRPALDRVFASTPNRFAWSSTYLRGAGTSIAWGVDFTYGISLAVDAAEVHEVRCVR